MAYLPNRNQPSRLGQTHLKRRSVEEPSFTRTALTRKAIKNGSVKRSARPKSSFGLVKLKQQLLGQPLHTLNVPFSNLPTRSDDLCGSSHEEGEEGISQGSVGFRISRSEIELF